MNNISDEIDLSSTPPPGVPILPGVRDESWTAWLLVHAKCPKCRQIHEFPRYGLNTGSHYFCAAGTEPVWLRWPQLGEDVDLVPDEDFDWEAAQEAAEEKRKLAEGAT